MAQKTIVVASIETGRTKFNKVMWTITTIEGENYTLFEDMPIDLKGAFLQGRGSVVEITTETKGEFENLKAAKFITKANMPEHISAADSKDLSVTLSYAVTLAANGKIPQEDILKWALKFYWHVVTMPSAPTPPKEAVYPSE